MKLLNYVSEDTLRLGIWTEKGILDVSKEDQTMTMEKLIALGDEGLHRMQSLLVNSESVGQYLQENEIIFGTPLTHPEKILCIGLNYVSHTEECHMELPKFPVVFSKFNNALAAHQEDIELPENALQVDYEAELVIVMGKTAKKVSREEALNYVFGYTVGNDLSARDLQFRTPQWLIGKTCDQFAPIGPWIVTREEIDPNHLSIGCTVNGERRQDGNTADMIFDCAEIIHYLSHQMTLKPGDLIFTGTPMGVILGYPEAQQVWLKKGDRVVVEIEGIGQLENRLI